MFKFIKKYKILLLFIAFIFLTSASTSISSSSSFEIIEKAFPPFLDNLALTKDFSFQIKALRNAKINFVVLLYNDLNDTLKAGVKLKCSTSNIYFSKNKTYTFKYEIDRNLLVLNNNRFFIHSYDYSSSSSSSPYHSTTSVSISFIRKKKYTIDANNYEFMRDEKICDVLTNKSSLTSKYCVYFKNIFNEKTITTDNKLPLDKIKVYARDYFDKKVNFSAKAITLKITNNLNKYKVGSLISNSTSSYLELPLTLIIESDGYTSHLALKDSLYRSSDGRYMSNTDDGIAYFKTNSFYLPVVERNKSYDFTFEIVFEEAGECNFDTFIYAFTIHKDHNPVGSCANSEFCVEENYD